MKKLKVAYYAITSVLSKAVKTHTSISTSGRKLMSKKPLVNETTSQKSNDIALITIRSSFIILC